MIADTIRKKICAGGAIANYIKYLHSRVQRFFMRLVYMKIIEYSFLDQDSHLGY